MQNLTENANLINLLKHETEHAELIKRFKFSTTTYNFLEPSLEKLSTRAFLVRKSNN